MAIQIQDFSRPLNRVVHQNIRCYGSVATCLSVQSGLWYKNLPDQESRTFDSRPYYSFLLISVKGRYMGWREEGCFLRKLACQAEVE